MVSVMRSGVAWLASRVKAACGEAITITRGATSASITHAIPGKTMFSLKDTAGNLRIEWSDQDFIVAYADLGALGFPLRGDKLTWGSKTYQVWAPGHEPEARWSDNLQTLVRIHLKQVPS